MIEPKLETLNQIHVHSFFFFFFGIKCLHFFFQMYFNFFCGLPDILLSGLCTDSLDPFHCRLCDHALR